MDQVDQERRLRQSAEEAMKLGQSNLLREKEERSIVELSMKDTIKRLRVEMDPLEIIQHRHQITFIKKKETCIYYMWR